MASRVGRTRVGARHAVPATARDPPAPPCDAAERKRLRDRVAQRNLRNKRNQHIRALEQQVKLCHDLHRTATSTAEHCTGEQSTEYIKTIRDLKAVNAILYERQKQLQEVLKSFKEVLEPVSLATENAVSGNEVSFQASPKSDIVAAPGEQTLRQATSPPTDASPLLLPSTSGLSIVSSAPCHPIQGTHTLADPHLDFSPWLAGMNKGETIEPHHHHHQQVDDTATYFIDHRATASIHAEDFSASGPFLLNTQFCPTFEPPAARSVSQAATSQPEESPPDDSALPVDAIGDFDATLSRLILINPSNSTGLCPWQPVPRSTIAPHDDLAPVWARIPARSYGLNDVRRPAWDANMRIIFDSPDTPSPLDLMYGSKHNPLADSLYRSCKHYYKGHAVRLAVGWQVYQYIKWRTQPTASRYASLPAYLKPSHEQIWRPHPGSLDLIVWEPLRRRMLRDYSKYNMAQFVLQYTRCLRLRWNADEADVLETNRATGAHVLCSAFVHTMMSDSGWGLQPEFRTFYPELFDDNDEWQKVVYDPHAMTGDEEYSGVGQSFL